VSATFLKSLVIGLFILYLCVKSYKPIVELMRELWLQFRGLTRMMQVLVLCCLGLFTNSGGAKFPHTPPQQESVISYSSTGFALDLPEAAQAETAFLSSNQLISGYAVVSCRQIPPGWTSNTNGLTLAECERWLKMGVAEGYMVASIPGGRLGRETNDNSLATAQAEIMESGDIFCRYCLPTNNFALTNYMVGIQNQTGGSSYFFALTNAVFENSELLFKNFGYLDPAISDHDNDGLSSALEVLVYNTNPHMPDTDLDGLSDADEIRLGTDPNNRDTRGNGIPDGSDHTIDVLSLTPPGGEPAAGAAGGEGGARWTGQPRHSEPRPADSLPHIPDDNLL